MIDRCPQCGLSAHEPDVSYGLCPGTLKPAVPWECPVCSNGEHACTCKPERRKEREAERTLEEKVEIAKKIIGQAVGHHYWTHVSTTIDELCVELASLKAEHIAHLALIDGQATEIEALKRERDEALANLSDACAARGQWRNTEIASKRLTAENAKLRERNQILHADIKDLHAREDQLRRELAEAKAFAERETQRKIAAWSERDEARRELEEANAKVINQAYVTAVFKTERDTYRTALSRISGRPMSYETAKRIALEALEGE